MKIFIQVYQIMCITITSFGLFFFAVFGILYFLLNDIDSASNYRIVQYPENDKLQTYIWAEKYEDPLLCYHNSVGFTVSSFDSISSVEKSKADKLVKMFEKLNKE